MAETQTNGVEVLETREWLDSLDYVFVPGWPGAGGTAAAATFAARAAGCRSQPSVHRHDSLPEHDRVPATAAISGQPEWSAASRAWCGGMPWPWWCGPTRSRKESAGTFPHSRPRPRCMKWPSIISCRHKRNPGIATWFFSRDTPRPACIPAPIWKAGFPKRSCKFSAAN